MNTHLPRPADTAMDCRRLRAQLCDPAAAPAAEPVSRHLASCPDCAAFARRLELVRQALAGPRSAPAIEPDPYFPARVLARIARPADLIGWAAFRALPAALGLALALAWLGLSTPSPQPPTAPPSPLLDESPSSEQLLAWSSLSPEVWP